MNENKKELSPSLQWAIDMIKTYLPDQYYEEAVHILRGWGMRI